MRHRQPPAVLLLLAERFLIGEQLLRDTASLGPVSRVPVIDQNSQVPAFALTDVAATLLHDVLSDDSLFLLLVQNGDLILLEDGVPVVEVAPFGGVDPFDDGGASAAGWDGAFCAKAGRTAPMPAIARRRPAIRVAVWMISECSLITLLKLS